MHCPFCQNPDTKVVDTRISDDGHSIRRRRECTHCGKRFTTVESTMLLVLKNSGNVEPFDRNKVIFSFTADGRVDFRELVKDVASVMHTRIELRQIYERDDIRMRGAMGMCGRPCCCIQFLDDFEKVTVKMAKNQNLSLNPTKVSGMCGKLMCCLKYENEYYAETLKLMPKHGARVKTADGVGRVDDIDVLRRRIRVAIENEDGVTKAYYGIGDFEVLAQGGKQHSRAEERKEDDSAPDDADTVE